MDLKKTLTNAGRKLFPAAEKLYNLGAEIANSPEVQFIRDSGQLGKLTQTMADNEIGTAFQNMMDAYKVYESSPKNMSPEARNAVYDLDKASNEYNQALQKWANYSTGWPKNKNGEYYWGNYAYKQRYSPDDYAGYYEYTVKGDKAQPIFQGERFQPTDPLLVIQSGADLLRKMNTLSKQYDEIGKIKQKVWQRWHALDSNGQGDTKEARDYFEAWSKLDDKYYDTLRELRNTRDEYWRYSGNF